VVSILSPPFALNGEALGQSIDEGVGNAFGEPGEEVQASMAFPGQSPGEIG